MDTKFTNDEIAAITANYYKAKRIFEDTEGYTEFSALHTIIESRIHELIRLDILDLERFHFDTTNDTVAIIIDYHGDMGRYTISLSSLMQIPMEEIKEHDADIEAQINQLKIKRNMQHTGEFIKTRSAMEGAKAAGLPIECPVWFKEIHNEILEWQQEMKRLESKKYISFEWN